MSLPPLPRIISDNFDIQSLEQNVAQAVNPLLAAPDAGKVAITNVAVSNVAATDIPHGLGRPIVGWVITRKDAQADVWDTQSTNPYPAKTLRLNASGPCTLSLLVW